MPGELRTVHAEGSARIVVTDSLTFCDERVGSGDVVVAGSFAGAPAFALVLGRGIRGLIAHAAGVGREAAGVSGLPLAHRLGLPAAAVETMSARLGDGTSVYEDGIVDHVNDAARAFGVHPGQRAAEAARRLLTAPPGRPPRGAPPVDRGQRVVFADAAGRIVLLASTSFATTSNRRDVLCAGSHGGRVNALPLLAIRPRGVIVSDGGMARDRSGVSGLSVLDEAGIAAAAVDVMSALIGNPESLWHTGIISAVNDLAHQAGVRIGQPATEAAHLMLLA